MILKMLKNESKKIPCKFIVSSSSMTYNKIVALISVIADEIASPATRCNNCETMKRKVPILSLQISFDVKVHGSSDKIGNKKRTIHIMMLMKNTPRVNAI